MAHLDDRFRSLPSGFLVRRRPAPGLIRGLLVALAVVSSAVGVRSMAAATMSPAALPLGIVVMHGKKGSPGYLAATRSVLESRGYLVSTPELCWSERRQYDRAYPDCRAEIDGAVADLKRRGARSIVIAGHSLGGGAALAYGADREGLAGIIGWAAGDAFWGPPSLLPDIARAKALVAEGKGDALDDFADIRIAGNGRMRTTATHFLSFVAPPAAETMPANAARLRAPLLLVAGTRDAITLQYGTRAYAGAPKDALNRFVEVDADHNGTLLAGMPAVLEWLAGLARGS